MKKNIAVVGGGNSSEQSISLKSAGMIMNWIDTNLYTPYLVLIEGNQWLVHLSDGCTLPIDKNDFSFSQYGSKNIFDCVVMAIHGTPGENGILQSYFELIDIPYNTPGVFTSALTFNKYVTKIFLREYGIKSAEGLFFRKNQQPQIHEIISKTGFPCFVKPNNSGSSCGVKKATNEQELKTAIEFAFSEDSEILIEKAIVGTEITHGVAILNNKELVFPITEIIPKNGFFDYEAKYKEGKSEEITPARISDELKEKTIETSKLIYKALDCKGIVRIDYIISNQELYFLEINTVPGMSPQSIIPQQINAMGLTVTEVYTLIIESCIEEFQSRTKQ